jgi:SAM-dependent methyltransferase
MSPPSAWLVRFARLLPPAARVLDVACGEGRQARWLAARGHPVVAVDGDAEALAAMDGIDGIRTVQADLESAPWPFAGERFDAVLVFRYLHRPLFGAFAAALAPDGVLLCETFAEGHEQLGRPRRPEFLLRRGELLDAFPGLTVVAFEQGAHDGAVVQRLAAAGPARAWPPEL